MVETKLHGKTALITGAASGIGAAIARRFAREGAKLVLNDINADPLNAFMKTLPAAASHVAVAGDISKADTSTQMAKAALALTGRIDILVNNAAMLHCLDLTDTTEDEFDKVMNVNVKSMYLCCKSVLPTMVSQHSGTIVNISSVSSMAAMEFDGHSTWLYSLSKGVAITLSRSLASRYAKDGIRVNAVTPGPTRTSQLKNMIPGLTAEQETEMWDTTGGEKTLLQRVGEPDEIANAVMFLACDESAFITGTSLLADGGYLAR